MGTVIPVDAIGATTVPGVYAAGNPTDISMTLIGSARTETGWEPLSMRTWRPRTPTVRSPAQSQMFEQPAWEDRYSGDRVVERKRQPATRGRGIRPRTRRALDVGCGEGADAIWLAGRGWSVTALDFAVAALDKTAAHAAQAGVGDRVTTRQADIRSWEPGEERWDLVSSQFMHLPDGGMVDVTRRLGSAVAPGGTLLVVGHHPDDMATGLQRGHHSFLFTPESLVPALEQEVGDRTL